MPLHTLVSLSDIDNYNVYWSCFSHKPSTALPVRAPTQNVNHKTKILWVFYTENILQYML